MSRIFIDVPAKERLWKALLLSFGNRVKVIGPEEYKNQIIAFGKEINIEAIHEYMIVVGKNTCNDRLPFSLAISILGRIDNRRHDFDSYDGSQYQYRGA